MIPSRPAGCRPVLDLVAMMMMILIILIMMMLHIVCEVIRFYFAPHVIVNAEAGYDKISDL